MRDRLLTALNQRLLEFTTTRDDRLVTGPVTADWAARLLVASADVMHDLEVRHAVGWFHWYRGHLIDRGDGRRDFNAAIFLLRPVFEFEPDAVPEVLREPFARPLDMRDPVMVGGYALGVLLLAKNGPEPAFLDQAVELSRRAAADDMASPEHLGTLFTLGLELEEIYQRTGERTALDAAITCLRSALKVSPEDHAGRTLLSSCLGIGLKFWFEQTGDLSALQEAIGLLRRGYTDTIEEQQVQRTYLSSLASALAEWFESTGELSALDEAVQLQRNLVASGVEDDPKHGESLANLTGMLELWFLHTGEWSAVEEAISVGRAAASIVSRDHPYRGKCLLHLGYALRTRYERTGRIETLAEAIAVTRQAMAAIPDGHPKQAMYLLNLGTVLSIWNERTGEPAALTEAVTLCRRAVAAGHDDSPDQARCLSALGTALVRQFELDGEAETLAEAIRQQRTALSITAADHPERCTYLCNLGAMLRSSFELTGEPATLAQAVDACQTAASMTSAAPSSRVEAAVRWGTLAAQVGEFERALAGFATAVELLPRVASRYLGRGDAEYFLARFAGLAEDAAACALYAGRPEQAVALLEQGRGVLLARAFEGRGDLTELRDRTPDLADHFTRLCTELDTSPSPDMTSDLGDTAGAGHSAAAANAARRRRDAARELDTLAARIRAIPGLERFLLPPILSELTAATAGGTAVLINVSRYRCDAFILTVSGLDVVPLQGLTQDEVHQRASIFLRAVDTAHDPQHSIKDRLAAQQDINSILAWLWDVVTGPVLAALDITHPTEHEDQRQRIWWVGSGLLSFLPLHAAGHHEEADGPGRRTVIDRVVSSYTPTLRILGHIRRHSQPTTGASARMLAISMPHTPAASDLPAALREAEHVTSRFLNGHILTGRAATRETLLTELSVSTWAHFACHCQSDAENPSASRLLLDDHQEHPLTMLDVSRLRLQHAELAYLSACSTTRTNAYLLDEAVHITAAFQIAGYRHVIGTLWTIDDTVAADIADEFYSILTAHDADADRAPFALHHATRRIRARYPNAPSIWAAHIHVGP